MFILHIAQALQRSQTVIAVYSSAEEFSNCSNGAHYTISIDDLPATSLTNGTELRFCSRLLKLNRSVNLSGVSNLAWVGYESTRISCTSEVGILLKNVRNLELRSLTIENCGVLTSIDSDPVQNIKAGVTIQNSTNITIAGVTITNSPGTGLALFYNGGSIQVENSVFEHNGQHRHSGGNGVYVETGPSSYTISNINAKYYFKDCHFLHNTAVTEKDSIFKEFSHFDRGGGICIYIRASENVDILISDSTFTGNQAENYGGGLFIAYNGRSSHNRAKVQNSLFMNNTAKYGGATYSGYLHTRVPKFATPQNCSHSFEAVKFIENSAYFGGGSSVFSSRADTDNREVNFDKCSWIRNEGQYGAALAITFTGNQAENYGGGLSINYIGRSSHNRAILPNAWNLYTRGFLPVSKFVNCNVTENQVKVQTVLERGNYTEYSKGSGAFFCLDHKINFGKTSAFENNKGTAMYLDLCTIVFSASSITFFRNNTGYQGGAIHELSSVIFISDRAEIYFIKNRAEDKGGAIYEHTSSMLISDYSKTCFIDYSGNESKAFERNISVQFVNNVAARYGHSIYASTLVNCYSRYKISTSRITADFFNQIGNFTYFPPDRLTELATAVNHTNITDKNWTGHVLATPGSWMQLPLLDLDDFGQHVETTYLVTIDSEANISTHHFLSEVSNENLLLYGKRMDSATVTLSDTSPRQNTLSFKVTLQACPPGFIHEEHSQSCICAFNTDEHYVGIDNCNLTQLRAYSKAGYWIGYDNNQTENEDSLVSGYCPRGFCSSGAKHLLPDKADKEELLQLAF